MSAGADWTTIDRDGSLRTAAWADGGVNDICPVGFSVPTKEEIKKDLMQRTAMPKPRGKSSLTIELSPDKYK
jgi:hypothetical protein